MLSARTPRAPRVVLPVLPVLAVLLAAPLPTTRRFAAVGSAVDNAVDRDDSASPGETGCLGVFLRRHRAHVGI